MKKYEEILRGILITRLRTWEMHADAFNNILDISETHTGVSSNGLDLSEILLELPKDPLLGDLAFPCFSLAKHFKKSPAIIAKELKALFDEVDFLEKTEVSGGYLNFFIKKSVLVEDTIAEIVTKKTNYGSSQTGYQKKALIEHTSINPNASPHVGRSRNALIGDALSRLLKFEGYEVEVQYFVNDIGKQISMLLYAAKDKSDIEFKDLLDLYVDINKRVEEEPALEKEIFTLLYKLENGDAEVKEGFRRIVDICIKGQSAIFNELGIKYDVFKYESDYIWSNRTSQLLEELLKTGKLEEDSEGRYVLNLEEYNLPLKAPYLVLTRQDKTTLYPIRDIAYSIDKANSGASRNIVVLGEDQKVYHKEVSAALDLLGYEAPVPVHYSFVLLPDGKMATRKGKVVLLEDLMEESLAVIAKGMKERSENYDETSAKAIAYGAIKYAFLKIGNDRNVTFDWEQALSFEGDSGPYLHYCYARISSILKKYGGAIPTNAKLSQLTEDVEFQLIKELAYFPKVVQKALNEYSPNIIANYVYNVAKKFSLFYHDCSVLNAESQELKDARILLISAVQQVLRNGMSLLGIDTVEVM